MGALPSRPESSAWNKSEYFLFWTGATCLGWALISSLTTGFFSFWELLALGGAWFCYLGGNSLDWDFPLFDSLLLLTMLVADFSNSILCCSGFYSWFYGSFGSSAFFWVSSSLSDSIFSFAPRFWCEELWWLFLSELMNWGEGAGLI